MPALVLAMGVGAGGPGTAQTVYSDPLFELGDGADPLVGGQGDIDGGAQAGPDWGDLFRADRGPKDVIDETGASVPNGVPDFLDGFGSLRSRRDAAFILDPIGDAGDPAEDIGNGYAYSGINGSSELLLYVGVERLTSAQSVLTFEFNRELFSLDGGGLPVGDRAPGDLRVDVDFTAGILSSITAYVWEEVDPQTETFDWAPVEILPFTQGQSAEQCNATGTICAVCNGVTISGGDWPNYDSSGGETSSLVSDTFLEFGLNLTQLVGLTFNDYYQRRYTSVQVSTALDYSLGYFNRAAAVAAAF